MPESLHTLGYVCLFASFDWVVAAIECRRIQGQHIHSAIQAVKSIPVEYIMNYRMHCSLLIPGYTNIEQK
jgi:hypothetical protein